MYSLDYGATWSKTETAIQTFTGGNLPHGVMADASFVHVIAEPGAGTYARRRAPQKLQFTSITQEEETVTITWTGQGILQEAAAVTGEWQVISNATSPFTTNKLSESRFFRLSPP